MDAIVQIACFVQHVFHRALMYRLSSALLLVYARVSLAPSRQVKAHDMSESLQQSAQEIAVKAFGEHTVEKEIAQYIKKEFDR